MAHDVFISYSAKDKPIADAVSTAIENRHIRCWVAPRDILPGQRWGAAIVDAINESRIMVVIVSAESNSSVQVIREIEQAVRKGITVLPFRIENVALSKDMDYFISTLHWLDAVTPPLQEHLANLSDTVGVLLSKLSGENQFLAGHQPTKSMRKPDLLLEGGLSNLKTLHQPETPRAFLRAAGEQLETRELSHKQSTTQNSGTIPTLTKEKAFEYLVKSGGDLSKALQMARDDGYIL